MSKNILFWIEGATLYLAIAKFLQEKTDFRIYGLIDVHSGKKFFETQKTIEFTKFWFYRDEITGAIKKDGIEYLKKIEEKYNINIWSIVYSDVWFNEYNRYYKYSHDQILGIFEKDCKFFERILDEVNPDFLVIRTTDASHMELLKQLCKARGVGILTLSPTRFGFRSIVTNETDRFNGTVLQSKKNYDFSKEDVLSFLKGYSHQEKNFRENFKSKKHKWFKGSFHFISLILEPSYSKYYRHFGMNLLSVFKNEIIFPMKRKSIKKFLDKNLIKNIPNNQKFIYFPLQLEPERTILVSAPYFSNQLNVISNISKSIPIGYKLYVKEHPMQKLKNWRGKKFYDDVIKLPNVNLFHPDISSDEMIEKCDLVITVTGTSAMEAAFHGKPSIVFSEVIFSELPSVFTMKNWEELPNLIKNALETKVKFHDIIRFTNKIIQNSFEFDDEGVEMKFLNEFYYGGYLLDAEISEKQYVNFLEKNRDTFEKLTNEFRKKI